MNPLPPRICPCGRPTVTAYYDHCATCIRHGQGIVVYFQL